ALQVFIDQQSAAHKYKVLSCGHIRIALILEHIKERGGFIVTPSISTLDRF
ncbi:MAG: hypothetical protein JRF58_15420, partial [Deltaproteobacteria bacterium]|nr:hypothetical protein [Deltaproteobacteria bacterium]